METFSYFDIIECLKLICECFGSLLNLVVFYYEYQFN